MATTQELIDSLKQDKQNLVTRLNNVGVEADNNETFTSLIPKVGKIVTQPLLQDKSIEIIENGTTNIVADEGYDGLNNVEVTVNVESTGSEGETPEIGFVVHEWNTSGKPTSIEYVGMTTISGSPISTGLLKEIKLSDTVTKIGSSAFSNYKSLEKIIFGNNVTTIEQGAFTSCENLALTELPTSLTGGLKAQTFNFCSKLAIKTIPDGVTGIAYSTFGYCTSIKQISMKNVTKIEGSSTGNAGFSNCSGITASWIGSAITNSGLPRYSFSGCTSLKRIFIDLPRTTVETFTNYQYAFMNDTSKTGIIICNDDEGFMTKEEFDAIDWNTYTD